ncbi:unnamed protein product [Didymodactylos carnosus]|uniref:Uncharacterized protein n=1 Tax=Didymodactylos carnosus TaxID=1234261 RepID=A0A814GTT2_9BILA|nr:unnamed protein product [Didymodactylos carnosus]CAF1361536.1 unnamed protein product [Didymodactylos carnosus]CAF3772595.1 unnamed protein product [Didymodactylos carnosus]CAF4171481.1 unnamed protein product [Didymodactylos carnosus]
MVEKHAKDDMIASGGQAYEMELPSIKNKRRFVSVDFNIPNRNVLFDDFIDAEQSSFEEIGGIVSNKDDSTLSCLTVRSWTIGILFTVLMAGLSQYLSFKTTYYFPTYLVLLLSHPIGNFLAWCSPKKKFRIPFFGIHSLNPGKFTIKEHAVIFSMAVTAQIDISAIETIASRQVYDSVKTGFGIGLMFVLSSQILGYGMAGKR